VDRALTTLGKQPTLIQNIAIAVEVTKHFNGEEMPCPA
jgi:hypothetical protein